MIRTIEVKNYRSLKYIKQHLGDFHVLVGANATGKSTFLDIMKFMADIVSTGVDTAIFDRVSRYEELTFSGNGEDIELALEALLPETIQEKFNSSNFDRIRYEIKIGQTLDTSENAINAERVILFNSKKQFETNYYPHTLFPDYVFSDIPVYEKKLMSPRKTVIAKKIDGNAVFTVEPTIEQQGKGSGWIPSFQLGTKKSALGNLPEDITKFPASSWLKSFLLQGIQMIILNSKLIQKPSPPGQSKNFKTDGSNLPWVIESLRKDRIKYNMWLEHIQTSLPDIEEILTIEREEDKHRYLKIIYKSGIEVPSWLISDGTLRLLALTLPAYLKDLNGVFLVEEPENGIHPKAIECVFQSLSSVYNAQILMASHSPVILGMVKLNQILCFGKTIDGITDIVIGSEHPKLKDWKGNPNLNLLFASGILS